MKEGAEKTERLASGSVGRQVLSFALTALAGLVFNSVYSLTDALFVGRGVGDAAIHRRRRGIHRLPLARQQRP